MLRTATPGELDKSLSQLHADLEDNGDSLLIRENGEAVAVLLTGSDYQRYRDWVTKAAWAMVEETREANASIAPDELSQTVDQIVSRVRRAERASRAAS